uniref:GST C-terminal domain-containing protein n=1 Tax=Globisporangium ultimum (strain ATCC 200006 / CBS 805.95 / DAOM BR144) TaxID=431595 RepID=K3X075_GLOUD
MPTDSLQRAHVRKLCSIIGCDIQPAQNLAAMAKTAETLSEEEKGETKIGWACYWIHRGFVALEKELQSTGGKFCVRDMVTLVDLYLVSQVYSANRRTALVDTPRMPATLSLNRS